jgi:phosphoglycerate kinase
MTIGTIKDLGAEGKTVLLRLDLNSPIDPSSNLILDDKRFREHLPTIRALSGSRVVIVTHQSRPGKKDFTTLEAHSEKLEQLLGKPVTYVDSIFSRQAREAVHAMKTGEVLMLENVRFNAEENLTLKPEEAKKTHLVKKLSSMADVFVKMRSAQPTVHSPPLSGYRWLCDRQEDFSWRRKSSRSRKSSPEPRDLSAWCSAVPRWMIPSMSPAMFSTKGSPTR